MSTHYLRPLFIPPNTSSPSSRSSATSIAHSILQQGEEWMFSCDGVGLYKGNHKIGTHQILSVQLTTHRLLFICPPSTAPQEQQHLQLHLSLIRQTEHYAGFLRSSPKITLHLGLPAGTAAAANAHENENGGGYDAPTTARGWTCTVCGFTNNEPSSSLETITTAAAAGTTKTGKCGLCGCPRSTEGGNGPRISQRTAVGSSTIPSTTTPGGQPQQIPCPRCTFLNDPHLTTCEICGAPTRAPAPPLPQSETETETIRLSFRKGGDKDLYKRLKTVLASRTWEGGRETEREDRNGVDTGQGLRAGTPSRGIGIDGILATIDHENRTKTEKVANAFEDLEALMVRAGEMVKLVQSLTAKLSSSSSTTATADAETRTFLHSSLVQLGLPVPAITEQSSWGGQDDEREYLDALADELAGLLTREQGGLMVGPRGRGLVGMDEAWVIWNRARGVALIPPKVMAKVVPLLPRHTRAPYTVEKLRFLSGLEVLHTPVYSPEVFARRVRRRLDPAVVGVASLDGGTSVGEVYTTALDIALQEALSVALTDEMMRFVMQIPDCGLVTDDGGGGGSGLGAGDGPVGKRWYRDLMTGFVWVDPN